MRLTTRIFFCLVLSVFTLLSIGVKAQKSAADVSEQKSTSKIDVIYDLGKDLTTVSLKSFTITKMTQEKTVASNLPLHQMDFTGSFSYPGQSPKTAVNDIRLRFTCVAGTYIFLRPQELIVALDREVGDRGRAFSLGTTEYKSLPPKFNTVFEEIFDLPIPVDALRKFATAKTVEFYIGPIVYKLTSKQMDAIKEWARFLPKVD